MKQTTPKWKQKFDKDRKRGKDFLKLKKRLYQTIKRHSEVYYMEPISYKFEEFDKWLLDSGFIGFYDDWQAHDKLKLYKPTIRKKTYKDKYELDNLKLGQTVDPLFGPGRGKKPIKVFKSNKLVGIYPSAVEACRQLDLSQPNVVICLKGRLKSHRGYTFEYV